jgi:phosphoesterase RecJ-like protein
VLQANSILLVAHVTPDPDALGSTLALAQAFGKLDKQVQVSVGEPNFALPESLSFLPGAHLVVAPEAIIRPDLVVACDTASVARLGSLAQVLANAPKSIVIDHHRSFTGYGDIHLVDAGAPAAAAVALQLIDRLGVTLTADIAACIYAGIATDTGSFKYASVKPETFAMAARLLETGFDMGLMARRLFDSSPYAELKMLSAAIERSVLIPDALGGRGIIYTSVSQEQRGALSEFAMERLIEVFRTVSEAELAAVFKQSDTGEWKVSLRSKVLVNVSEIAMSFAGGGHRNAAGYTSDKDLVGSVAALLAKVEQDFLA